MARINLEGLFETMVWYPASTSALTGRLGTKPMNDERIWMMGDSLNELPRRFHARGAQGAHRSRRWQFNKENDKFREMDRVTRWWADNRRDIPTKDGLVGHCVLLVGRVPRQLVHHQLSLPQPIIENIATVIYAAVTKGFICKIVLRAKCNQIG